MSTWTVHTYADGASEITSENINDEASFSVLLNPISIGRKSIFVFLGIPR